MQSNVLQIVHDKSRVGSFKIILRTTSPEKKMNKIFPTKSGFKFHQILSPGYIFHMMIYGEIFGKRNKILLNNRTMISYATPGCSHLSLLSSRGPWRSAWQQEMIKALHLLLYMVDIWPTTYTLRNVSPCRWTLQATYLLDWT